MENSDMKCYQFLSGLRSSNGVAFLTFTDTAPVPRVLLRVWAGSRISPAIGA